MKQIIYNAQTGDIKEIEVESVEIYDIQPMPQPPTQEERLEALEKAMLEMILGGGAV